MSEFSSYTVAELNTYLKDRGISFSGNRKAELVQLCVTAKELQIAVDPDGLSENKSHVISQKLFTGDCNLTSPDLHEGTSDISNLPGISIFDIYNYLISYDQFSHASVREYHKMEGFCMFKDGYVMQLETVSYHGTDFVAIKSRVKPRTNDKDPLTKKGFYSCWIIIRKSSDACIHSAYCTCKGGIDGCCRHVVATLFEINDYQNDSEKKSCTSHACSWVRRSSQAENIGKPIPVADLDTSVLPSNGFTPKPLYSPLPEQACKPDTAVFMDNLKTLCPSACGMRLKYIYPDEVQSPPPLTVETPVEKIRRFNAQHVCCNENCTCANLLFIIIYVTLIFSKKRLKSAPVVSQQINIGMT